MVPAMVESVDIISSEVSETEITKKQTGLKEESRNLSQIIKKRVSNMSRLKTDHLGMLLKANQDVAGRDDIIFQ
ncbi:hypothetical protein RND71_008475 [Anisodus tanguticus]|uniref:Uncharacterized protein n=1 Tax=Anisodus tanguticus TaxID=243964 RepID=A0AAE1VQS0_9SOLA|nr:hypothetical protein RND71_008475 [Anisodus tanguticus]